MLFGIPLCSTREATLGSDHVAVGGPLQNLAAVYQGQHRYSEAKDLYARAIDRMERAGGDRSGIAAARSNLAMVLAVEREAERAIQEATTAVSIWESIPNRKGLQLATALNVLAAACCRAKTWPEAEEPIRRTQELILRTLGSRNVNLEPILRTYAEVLAHTGRKREAKQEKQIADEIARESSALNITRYTVDAASYRVR
jgi:tetratricopeptide (TPR) repeat protein